MNILITSGIFPPEIGGPARMIKQLSSDLNDREINVTVLTFGKDDGKARPHKVIRASGKIDFLRHLLRLGRKVDIIYAFDLYTAGFLSWLIGKQLLRKKLIVRFAGDSAWESAYNKGQITDDIITFQEKKYGWRISWSKFIRKLILNGADRVVAVSQFMRDLAIRIRVSPEKIQVIYNSVDFIDIKNLDERTRGLQHQWGLADRKVLVAGGRLVPWKGIEGLIEVVSELKERSEPLSLKLLIVGEGHDRERLKKIVEDKKLASEVIFTGRISLDEIIYYYNLADIFILNSKYEGLSHMLLEALNLGRSVIASNCGGNPEVIEDGKNGLLVEYNNVEQLKLAIKRMLTEPYWQSVEHKNTCQESLKKFNWVKNIEETIKVFKVLTF